MRNENLGSDTTAFHLTFDAADDYGDIIVDVGGTTAATLRVYANGTIKFPAYTVAQKGALTNLVEGQIIFDSDNSKLNFWNGLAWEVVTSA